jgi:hypothetical protein
MLISFPDGVEIQDSMGLRLLTLSQEHAPARSVALITPEISKAFLPRAVELGGGLHGGGGGHRWSLKCWRKWPSNREANWTPSSILMVSRLISEKGRRTTTASLLFARLPRKCINKWSLSCLPYQ